MTFLRGSAVVVAASALAGLIMALVYAPKDGAITSAFLAASGLPVLVLAHRLAAHRDRIGSLSRQFRAAILIAVGLALAGVVVVALLMFVSTHDALTAALLIGFAGVVAACSASLIARAVLADVRTVRDGLARVGAGERDVRIATAVDDELGELAEAANAMTRRLAETEAARRDLVAAVSHDLRTPLTSLRLLAQAVEDEVVDAGERRRYVERMSVHIRSLSALIDDLFELSRLEAGDIEWSMQRVQICDLVEETVEAMRPHAAARGVEVRAEVPDGLAPAEADPEKVQRVLFNLIQNAIRHTPADGSVTVAAEANGSSLEIGVVDTGRGVADRDRERLFEPFFRGGDASARPSDGSGLGLSICRAIVEAHGGRIWLADSDAGAHVRFTLPRAA
ncbi:MAG TPA: HAMP domain-containing sensor histidine kinase [Solirubrobacteraceae bacterium]|nr:HAMP domain-containing sensor histidine kinase [Solirubrobacteraceae bacterium]